MGLASKPKSRLKSGGDLAVRMAPKQSMKSRDMTSSVTIRPGQTFTISKRK